MSEQLCPGCAQPYNPGEQSCRRCGFPLPSSLVLSPGTIVKDRFEVKQLIHTGGMSYIYLANDKSLFERACVLKMIKDKIESEEHLKKLEEEAFRMAKLSHPSIAIIFEHFTERGYYFLVEEYIRGKSLSDIVKERRTRPSEDEVVRWGISICEVLAAIHNQGIIHRDISPDNVMLTEEGDIKFIDFGTLRELRYIAAGRTAGMGKYGYTPPEQWQGKPGVQSDIFALGATMYQLLTGFLPLSRAYLTGQAPQQEDFFPKFPPIRSQNKTISPYLEATLQKALQLDASRRYASAVEMRAALQWTRSAGGAGAASSNVNAGLPGHNEKTQQLPLGIAFEEGKHKRSERKKRSAEGSAGKKRSRAASVESSESAIKRKTVTDTLQQPVTLISLAVCVTSAVYLLLLSPVFGGSSVAIATTGVSAITAIVSCAVNYPKEYLKNTRDLMTQLDDERQRLEELHLEQLRETLQNGFLSASTASRGTGVLNELFSQYTQLQVALKQQRATDPLSVSVIPALAGETYRRGLGVLSDALELMNVVQTPGKVQLEQEIMMTEIEIDSLKDNDSQAERLRLKQEILASLKERLSSHDRLQLWVEQLFYQAHRCEAALHTARVELATVRAGSTKSSVDSVIEVLQERIKQVKEVQEELNRLGY